MFLTDIMEEDWDLSNLKEDEFEDFCVYIVHDRPCDRVCPNRAQASLPRNLTLKPSQVHSNVSINFNYIWWNSSPVAYIPSWCKVGTCAHDKRALQQLALNVHVKYSDLTWPDLRSILTNEITWDISCVFVSNTDMSIYLMHSWSEINPHQWNHWVSSH